MLKRTSILNRTKARQRGIGKETLLVAVAILATIFLAAPDPAGGSTHSVPAAKSIYFTDGGFSFSGPNVPGRIRQANLDGSGLVDIVPTTEPITPFKPWGGFSRPQGMALDAVNGKLYWVDFASGLFSANLDGTAAELIGPLPANGYHGMQGVDVDEIGGTVYWGPTHQFFSPGSPGQIRSSNLNGTGTAVLLSNAVAFFPGLLAVDPAGGKMYWGNVNAGTVMVANLNGTGAQTLLAAQAPRGIALDVAAGKIYFTSALPFGGGGQIFSANLDGTGLQTLVTGLAFPFGIALDLGAGHMYWTDLNTDKIQRANLDGTGVIDILTGLDSPQGIALEPILDSDGDGVPDNLDVCPGTVIPESVPTVRLGTNRWALTDGDGIFDTTLPPGGGEGPGRSYTIDDTAGCSCEQIIAALGLGKGHTKVGCSISAMDDWVALVNP